MVGSLYSLSVARFPRALNRTLVLAEIDESRSKTSPVGDAREEDLSSLVQLVLETLLSDFKNVRNVGHRQEVLHVMQTIRLRICVCQLGVNLRLAERLAGHLEVTNKVVGLAGATGDFDNLGIVRRILGLDVRV